MKYGNLWDPEFKNYEFKSKSICDANMGNYMQKAMLDYINAGATLTRPTAWWVALSTGSPTGATAAGLLGEIALAGSNYARVTCAWGAALGSAGVNYSAFNTNAMTFGPFSSSFGATGIGILDHSTAVVANVMWYGTLAALRAVTANDQLIIAASALTSQVN